MCFTTTRGSQQDLPIIMDLEILDRKIKRLQCKLKKYNIDLEIFEHEDIEYGAILGKGGEGLVQKCIVTYNGIPVDAAVKTVTSKGEEDDVDDAINITIEEIELLCLGNDRILDCTLRVYGVAAIPDHDDPELGHLAIVMEAGLMNALQLYQEEEIPLHVNYDLWSRLAAAVHCLHSKKIIHHDLKPENILITGVIRDRCGQTEKLMFKIIDLGMGRRLYSKKIVTDDILGTNGYHPPEVLMEDSYDFRADVFMLGVTFCVLLHAKSFLKSSQLQSLLRKLHLSKKRGVAGEQLYETVLEHNISHTHEDISPLIRSMLCNMLETQENRDIALERVVEICREESEREQVRTKMLPPALTPSTNCQDSGVGSCEGSAGDGTSKRNQKDTTGNPHPIQENGTKSTDGDINGNETKGTRAVKSRKRLRSCSSASDGDVEHIQAARKKVKHSSSAFSERTPVRTRSNYKSRLRRLSTIT